jgi:hypothetical protein
MDATVAHDEGMDEGMDAATVAHDEVMDEGLDAATVAHDHINQALKIINGDVTPDWAKNSLVRGQIMRAQRAARNHLAKARAEMRRFAAGRTESDAIPPYMDMVDVDDLKAACNLYEKRLFEEAARANRFERAHTALEAKMDKASAEIEELKGLRLSIAELEVTNDKVVKELAREKKERIQGAGRTFFLEQDCDALKKEVTALTEELQRASSDNVLDGGGGGGGEGGEGDGERKKISGGSMADAYDEQQQQEIRGLRHKVEKQDVRAHRALPIFRYRSLCRHGGAPRLRQRLIRLSAAYLFVCLLIYHCCSG